MEKRYQKLMGVIVVANFMFSIGAGGNAISAQDEPQKKEGFTLGSVKEKLKSVKEKLWKKKDPKKAGEPVKAGGAVDELTPLQMECIEYVWSNNQKGPYYHTEGLFKRDHEKCMETQEKGPDNKPLPESFFENLDQKLYCVGELLHFELGKWETYELAIEKFQACSRNTFLKRSKGASSDQWSER